MAYKLEMTANCDDIGLAIFFLRHGKQAAPLPYSVNLRTKDERDDRAKKKDYEPIEVFSGGGF